METPSSQEAVAAQDDGPSWYFRDFPLGLDPVPGISRAGRGLEGARKAGASGGVEALRVAERVGPTNGGRLGRILQSRYLHPGFWRIAIAPVRAVRSGEVRVAPGF